LVLAKRDVNVTLSSNEQGMRMANKGMTEGGVEAVERALKLLEAFVGAGTWLELRELASRSGLNKATILRIARSLEAYGHLRSDAQGRYALGPGLWRLGSIYRRSFDIGDLVRPILQDLVERTLETAAFYVRIGDARVCLYRRNSPRPARHVVEEGNRLPLDAGSGGHVLMAFAGTPGTRYDQIRRDGYCVSRGERDPDVVGIGAPVFGSDRELVGALLLSGLKSRFGDEEVEQYIGLVTAAAKQLSEGLGSRREPVHSEK
jgi:DNA-binding IclR family transcriptional regulator